jgi:hypothetical protein
VSDEARLPYSAELGKVAEYLVPENWSREIPGLNRLVGYLKKIARDGRIHEFVGLVKGPNDICELAAAASLIWYLDSGGRRNYVIASRPDQTDRTRPSPDFLLQDETTRHKIVLEVTSVFPVRAVEGALPHKQHVASFLEALLNKNGQHIPVGGWFNVVLGNGSTRGLSFDKAVTSIASAMLAAASTMEKAGEEQVLDQWFRIRLIRRTTREPGEPAEFHVDAQEDYDRTQRAIEIGRRTADAFMERLLGGGPAPVQDRPAGESGCAWPPKWEIPGEIAEALRRCLAEADSKFSGFDDGTECALLVQLNLPLLFDEPLAYVELLSTFSTAVNKVHRLYVMFENDYTEQWIVARVW